jgi:uncharacterized oligopeptide transporter (OPT) family protein
MAAFSGSGGMVKWGLITFGIGIVLMIIDIQMAKKKKGGFSPTDRQRVVGMFWTTVFATALVVGLIYIA